MSPFAAHRNLAWRLVLVGAASCAPVTNLPSAPVESGFVTGQDSLPFANFGGTSATSSLSADGLARMFGAENVCSSVSDAGVCRPTEVARAWLKRINESMAGGRCEGFAVLAGMVKLGVVDPQALGAPSIQALPKSPAATREIAYWYATQFLPVTKDLTRALTAKEAVALLSTEYAKPDAERDLWRIGVLRLENGVAHGGHAVLATGVAPVTGAKGRYLIRVYDNNHPDDVDRAIEVDTEADSWSYQAATNPDEPSGIYEGNPTNGNVLMVSPIRARAGVQPCRFCAATEGSLDAPLAQVFGSAGGEVTVTDARGVPVGEVQSVFSELLPWEDRVAPVRWVAPSQELRFEVKGEALAMVGAGWSMSAQQLPPDGQHQFKLAPLGTGLVARVADGGASALTLSQTRGDRRQEIAVTLSIAPGSREAAVGLERTGAVSVRVETLDGGPASVTLDVTRSSASGEEHFEAPLTLPSGATASTQTDGWAGDGAALPVELDTDGDGTPDLEVAVADSSSSSPPAAPSGLGAVSVEGPLAVELAWADEADNEAEQVLERAEDDGAFLPLQRLPANATTARDTLVSREHRYQYRVRAENAAGASPWAHTQLSLAALAPLDLHVVTSTIRRVSLAWVDRASRETGTRFERSMDGSVFTMVGRVGPDADTFVDATVAADTRYTYRAVVEGPGGEARAEVTTQTPAVPPGSASLVATALAPQRLQLTWAPVTAVGTLALERSTEGGPFTPLARLASSAVEAFDDTATAETAYTYRLRSETPEGESPWVTSNDAITPPPAAMGLQVTARTASEVTLAWVDVAARETGYRVERSGPGNTPWAAVHTGPSGSSSYVDGALAEATAYVYRVVAIGPGGETPSAPLDVTTLALPPTPTGLAVMALSAASAELTWSSPADPVHFVLERSVDGAGYVERELLAGTARQFVDATLTEAATVRYRLRARSPAGDSGFAQSAACTTPPPPPAQLVATAQDANTVALTWTDGAAHETAWRVERAPLAGSYTALATLGVDASAYLDVAAVEGVTSTYRVTVVGPGGERSVTADVAVPAATPLNPSAVATSGARVVTVSWVDVSSAETGFEVERAVGAGPFTTLTTVAAGVSSAGDTTVDWGTSYAYRVRALGVVPSAFSASVVVTLPDACLNGVRDGAEPDIDCGASCAVACAVGQACATTADCGPGDTCAGSLRCEAPCGPGQHRPATDCVDVGLGWWSPSGSDVRTACTNLPANAEYTSPVASSAECPWSCLSGYLRNATTQTCDANASARYLRCAPGEVMVGLHGNSGAWLDAMGVICAPYALGVLGAPSDAAVVGGTGGTAFRLECAAGEVAQKVSAINGWSTASPNAAWCNAVNLSRVWLECVNLQSGVVTPRGSTASSVSCTVASSPGANVSQDCGVGRLMLGVTVDSLNTAGYVGFLLDKVCR